MSNSFISPRVFDEKPIKAGIGAGGPSTFEELLERELRSQPRTAQAKASAQNKNIPPRATTPTGKKFDKLKLVNRSASSGNMLPNGTPPSVGPRSASIAQFAPSLLPASVGAPIQEEDEEGKKVDGSRGVKRSHSRSTSNPISPRGLISPRAAVSPRGNNESVDNGNIVEEQGGDADKEEGDKVHFLFNYSFSY